MKGLPCIQEQEARTVDRVVQDVNQSVLSHTNRPVLCEVKWEDLKELICCLEDREVVHASYSVANHLRL